MEVKQMSRKRKLAQLENTAETFALMLKREGFIAYKNKITFQNDEEMKDYINKKIDVCKYFDIKLGQGIPCLRTSCNNVIGANFYKSKGTTLYKCHNCNCWHDTISLFELILEVYKQQLGIMDYNAVMFVIRMQFVPDYKSDFYKEFQNIIEHNRMMINNLHHRKYLARLFKRRNLFEFYEDFTELALIYMKEDEEIPYSFYCSNSVIKRTFTYILGKPGSNYQIEKTNLLVALGLIEKLDEDNCSKRMRAKIIRAKTIANKDKGYIKATNAYRLKKLTLEDIQEAERKAKIIIDNKVYVIKKDTFKEIAERDKKANKEAEVFIRRAKKAIKEELKAKGYIQVHKIVSKIDKKGKFYNKEQKQKLLDEHLKRIMSDYKLEIILVNENARKILNLTKSVKDNTEILVRQKNDITERKKTSIDNDVIIENVETVAGLSTIYTIEDISTTDVPF